MILIIFFTLKNCIKLHLEFRNRNILLQTNEEVQEFVVETIGFGAINEEFGHKVGVEKDV